MGAAAVGAVADRASSHRSRRRGQGWRFAPDAVSDRAYSAAGVSP
jgi:hypothetical protein